MQPKLFFVLGAPKSGTTWLQHLLNAHPNLSCRGEGRFHKFAVELEALISKHNAMLIERERLHGTAFPPMSDREIVALGRAFIEIRMRSNPTPKPDLQWIGEKDPDHAFCSNGIMALFPTASFIHIIRDPRDRAVSVRFHMLHLAQGERTKRQWHEHVLNDAKIWGLTVAGVRQSAKQHPSACYHELRYEDLLDRPQEILAKVLNFLGVDTAPTAACIEAASFEKLSGGRKPGQEDQASFFRKGIKGDWRNHMDAEQERAFVAATGGLMAELGYA